jgi:hypothetical protein
MIRYELHIRPMFRLIDRDHMLFAFDLHDYQAVKDNASSILSRLRVDMPPASLGGPWPAEWIGVFERWITEGFGRLEFAQNTSYRTEQVGSNTRLIAEGTFPSDGYKCWFDRLPALGRQYTCYWQGPDTQQPPHQTPFVAADRFKTDPTLASVVVFDAQGSHTVPIKQA